MRANPQGVLRHVLKTDFNQTTGINIMQTISTNYLAPTNHRGSRIKATASGNDASVTIAYPYDGTDDSMHWQAANALRAKLNWKGAMVRGHTKTGMIFVFDDGQRFGA